MTQADFNREEWAANRVLPTDAIMERIPAILADCQVGSRAYVVGAWVWVEFAKKPGSAITARLRQLGFKWNKDRECWQHPCGVFTKSAPYDPRAKYGEVTFYEDETKH